MKNKEQLAKKYCNEIYQDGVHDLMYAPDVHQSKRDFIAGFEIAQKQLKDSFNHYNSKLKEATKIKLGRYDYRTEYIIKLESKVELLQEMLKQQSHS